MESEIKWFLEVWEGEVRMTGYMRFDYDATMVFHE